MTWSKKHLGLIGYLLLALGVAIGFYFLNQSRVALCALRHDLDDRITASEIALHRGDVFLRKHPHGAFGFSRRDIELSIQAQRRQLKNSLHSRRALGAVRCGKTTE